VTDPLLSLGACATSLSTRSRIFLSVSLGSLLGWGTSAMMFPQKKYFAHNAAGNEGALQLLIGGASGGQATVGIGQGAEDTI
jgi:hypothetical protein